MTITGCGDHYTGQIIKYFNITKEFIDISTSDKITLTGLEDQSYNLWHGGQTKLYSEL